MTGGQNFAANLISRIQYPTGIWLKIDLDWAAIVTASAVAKLTKRSPPTPERERSFIRIESSAIVMEHLLIFGREPWSSGYGRRLMS